MTWPKQLGVAILEWDHVCSKFRKLQAKGKSIYDVIEDKGRYRKADGVEKEIVLPKPDRPYIFVRVSSSAGFYVEKEGENNENKLECESKKQAVLACADTSSTNTGAKRRKSSRSKS